MHLFSINVYTPLTTLRLDKLQSMIICTSPACERQALFSGFFFWRLPVWNPVSLSLSLLLRELNPTPLLRCLELPLHYLYSISPKKDVTAFKPLLARCLILTTWKSSMPTSHICWIRDVLYFIKLQKIRISINGLFSKFDSPTVYSLYCTYIMMWI